MGRLASSRRSCTSADQGRDFANQSLAEIAKQSLCLLRHAPVAGAFSEEDAWKLRARSGGPEPLVGRAAAHRIQNASVCPARPGVPKCWIILLFQSISLSVPLCATGVDMEALTFVKKK